MEQKMSFNHPSISRIDKTMEILNANPVSDLQIFIYGNVIDAHKAILRSESNVFARMFDQDMKKSAENKVAIDGIELPIMKKLVNFMYCGGISELDFETAAELYYAADRYEVIDLRNICRDSLIRQLTVENATQLLILADNHDDGVFKDTVLEFMSSNMAAVLGSDGWFEFIVKRYDLASIVMENMKTKITCTTTTLEPMRGTKKNSWGCKKYTPPKYSDQSTLNLSTIEYIKAFKK